MSDKNRRVSVTILDKEYQVACGPEEKQALVTAAADLDSRMRAVRRTGGIVGLDRIAVMVALNLCHELHQAQAELNTRSEAIAPEALERILKKIEGALDRARED